MILQTAKGLLKQFKKAKSGERPEVNSSYLTQFASLLKKECSVEAPSDFTPEIIYEALKIRSTYSVFSTFEK